MTVLAMTRGDDVTLTVTLRGGWDFEAGDQLWLTATERLGDSPTLQKTTADFTFTAGSPVATVPINNADTSGLPDRTTTLIADLQMRRDGNIYTLRHFTIEVTPDVTLATS